MCRPSCLVVNTLKALNTLSYFLIRLKVTKTLYACWNTNCTSIYIVYLSVWVWLSTHTAWFLTRYTGLWVLVSYIILRAFCAAIYLRGNIIIWIGKLITNTVLLFSNGIYWTRLANVILRVQIIIRGKITALKPF